VQRKEEALLLKFRPSLLLWVHDTNETSDDVECHKRILDLANHCRIPLQELSREKISNNDIRDFFAPFPQPRRNENALIIAIAGKFLEDQISRCCLQAIAIGYDTHLLCDVVHSYDETMFQTHLARLIQAGVVPSSLNQLASFLIAEEENVEVAASLRQYIRRTN
jgi:hypothetical protein